MWAEMKRKTNWILWSFAVFLVVIGLTGGAWYRLAQIESGVCEKVGRVLTKWELRRAVLQNLVDLEIGNVNRACGITSSCIGKVGIARNPEELDVVKLIGKAVQSDKKTFVENFGLELITPIDIRRRNNLFDISSIKEPFILAGYSEYPKPGSGMAYFYVSTHVQEAYFDSQLSLYRRLLGYGKYYFYIPRVLFGKSCCDKSVPREEREDSYKSSLRTINRISKLPKEVVPVSNCGKLLTEREKDTGLRLHQLVYLTARIGWGE
jgi:hypothetical protein